MNRRHFLRHSVRMAATLPALTVGGKLFAAPDSPRFLLVFLRGGYDCANVLVPYSSDFYYESRPRIAIARPNVDAPLGALELDADWALAPALREFIGPLFERKQAAFIPFAGTDDLSRSHFETQDSIELGLVTGEHRDFHSGFLGRLAAVLQDTAPISFTDALPLVFRGAADIPNVSLKVPIRQAFDRRQAEILASMYAEHHLGAAVKDGLALRQEVAQSMEEEMREANRGAITARGFELEAARIAKLLREQYRVGFVDIGGWDTHVNEGGAQGTLANNLQNLGRGLQTLAESMGPAWAETVVVVISEFGRTFRENGNAGTDHGHGSVYWVLGGGIDGGRLAGEQVAVKKEALFQNRDFPVLNDYRSLLSGIFKSLWPLSDEQLQRVFPDAAPIDLKLV